MPFRNLPDPGVLYIPNWNNIPWTQPGGPNTTVFPTEAINVPMTSYPVPGQIISETTGLFVCGCGHYNNGARIFKDYDNMLGVSVAVLCCPICTFIQNYVSPYEDVFDVMKYPIVIV